MSVGCFEDSLRQYIRIERDIRSRDEGTFTWKATLYRKFQEREKDFHAALERRLPKLRFREERLSSKIFPHFFSSNSQNQRISFLEKNVSRNQRNRLRDLIWRILKLIKIFPKSWTWMNRSQLWCNWTILITWKCCKNGTSSETWRCVKKSHFEKLLGVY